MSSTWQPTRAPRAGGSAMTAGVVLILIGAFVLVTQLWPQYNRYVPLAVGLVLLATFAGSRSYPALVFGSILTGLGAGLLVAQLFPGPQSDAVGAVLGLGSGFLFIWLANVSLSLTPASWWPLIPGTILTIVGLGLAADAFQGSQGELIVPIAVIAIGVLVAAGGLITSRRGGADSA